MNCPDEGTKDTVVPGYRLCRLLLNKQLSSIWAPSELAFLPFQFTCFRWFTAEGDQGRQSHFTRSKSPPRP